MLDPAAAAAVGASEIVNPNTATRTCAWPIVIRCSLVGEQREETLELVTTAMEKFVWETTEIAKYLKVRFECFITHCSNDSSISVNVHQKELDMRFGCAWHVVVGEEFGFDVDFEGNLPTMSTIGRGF